MAASAAAASRAVAASTTTLQETSLVMWPGQALSCYAVCVRLLIWFASTCVPRSAGGARQRQLQRPFPPCPCCLFRLGSPVFFSPARPSRPFSRESLLLPSPFLTYKKDRPTFSPPLSPFEISWKSLWGVSLWGALGGAYDCLSEQGSLRLFRCPSFLEQRLACARRATSASSASPPPVGRDPARGDGDTDQTLLTLFPDL